MNFQLRGLIVSLSGLLSLQLDPLTIQATAQPESVLASSLLSSLNSQSTLSKTTPKQATTAIEAISKSRDIFGDTRGALGHIASFLSIQEIGIVRSVCKASSKLSPVKDGFLDLSGLPNLSNDALKTILHEARASGTAITSINLSNCKNITDAGLAHLSELTLLSSLDLSGCPGIRGVGFAYLSKLTSLRSLNLSGCRITDAGLAYLSELKFLRSLNLSNCTDITDAGLAHLSKLTSLRSLNLSGCIRIRDAGLAHLSELKSLRSLNLRGCFKIADAGLAHLITLTFLRYLDLRGCSSNISDAGVAHLLTLPSLYLLNLNWLNTNITDAGFEHLGLKFALECARGPPSYLRCITKPVLESV